MTQIDSKENWQGATNSVATLKTFPRDLHWDNNP